MTTCSTHVLDAALGVPAPGLTVVLSDADSTALAHAVTDGDGRIRFDVDLDGGTHALTFATGEWFAGAGRETFFPVVNVVFDVDGSMPHHHVALLLSPFAYSTYRGS